MPLTPGMPSSGTPTYEMTHSQPMIASCALDDPYLALLQAYVFGKNTLNLTEEPLVLTEARRTMEAYLGISPQVEVQGMKRRTEGAGQPSSGQVPMEEEYEMPEMTIEQQILLRQAQLLAIQAEIENLKAAKTD